MVGGRDRDTTLRGTTGWPGAVARTPAPTERSVQISRTTLVRSCFQRGDSLQLRVREIQLWSQQRKPLLDLLELLPPDLPLPTPAAQQLAPVTFHRPMDPLQGADVPSDAVVRIVTAEHLIEAVGLFQDR